MRLLFVTPFPPSPQRPAPLNHIMQLSQRHSIVLVSLVRTEQSAAELQAIRPYCEEVVPVPLSRPALWANAARFALSPTPLFAGLFHSEELRRQVNRLARQGRFDLLHVHHIRAARLVTDVAGLPGVFDAQDCMTMLMERHFRSRPGPAQSALYWTEWRKMAAYEPRICEAFQHVTVCSKVDEQALKAMSPGLATTLIRNGVDLERFRPAARASDAPVLAFTGRLSYYPNRDALSYFYSDIFPLVRAQVPAARLIVVGGGLPAGQEAALRRDPAVELVGETSDVRPYVQRAQVSVAPMRLGAGSNYKIIESLAMGVPVVTSSQGCAGLDVVPGRDLLSADTPDQFARDVCELLHSSSLRRELARCGREYVETYHDWATIVGRLEAVHARVAGRRG